MGEWYSLSAGIYGAFFVEESPAFFQGAWYQVSVH